MDDRRNAPARGERERARNPAVPAATRQLIGRSPAIRRLIDLIGRVAPLRATVLITGETGTGKELVARAIHDASPQARHAFVAVNCAALPDTLLEAELFGHVRGSFTGAIADRRGLVEEAASGTLFLDEISSMSAHAQGVLLRALEERVIQPIGSARTRQVDFRLLAATNADLAAATANGTFREDLFYRLNVFPIRVPPLRERTGDIPLLVEHFRREFGELYGIPAPPFDPVTIERLCAYEWPGNVRQLAHFIERALISSSDADPIAVLPPHGRTTATEMVRQARKEHWDLQRLEREYILAVLQDTGGHQGHAADVLGIDRRTLYRKLRALRPIDAATI